MRFVAWSEGAQVRMVKEQAAIAWAAVNGLPVARPLATQRGETLHECEGRWWSVSPWVKGGTYRRWQMSPPGADTSTRRPQFGLEATSVLT